MSLNTGAGRLKARAFRWMLCAVLASAVFVALAFLNILPIAISYWVGLALAVFAIACMAVYFVAHSEIGNRES
jgi:hypothetical protein